MSSPTSAAAPLTNPLTLDIGPGHPGLLGLMRLHLQVAGERIVSADPEVGFMHRGAEKLCEVRDYRQIMALANRHEWLSAFPGELGVALLVEDALGMEVPQRATWIRTLVVEANRVLAHLVFLGTIPDAAGHPGALEQAFALREPVQTVLESLTGARLHYMYACVGGVRADLPAGWVGAARAAIASTAAGLDELAKAGSGRLVARHLRGLGRIPEHVVEAYGLSGPVARASGVDRDLRRDAPTLAYREIFTPADVVTATEGDAQARYEVALAETRVSLRLMDACLDHLDSAPAGPVNIKLPKVLRLPEGTYYQESENPLGVAGYYVVSRGEKAPWRFAMRTPSFATLSALPEIVPGADLGQLHALLASLMTVAGDADR